MGYGVELRLKFLPLDSLKASFRLFSLNRNFMSYEL